MLKLIYLFRFNPELPHQGSLTTQQQQIQVEVLIKRNCRKSKSNAEERSLQHGINYIFVEHPGP